ncbi:MAG: hypothetical protein O2894_01560 [Planctomycetota bacterium]|nr:hypothetical protein [Planctomycetota bacterium]
MDEPASQPPEPPAADRRAGADRRGPDRRVRDVPVKVDRRKGDERRKGPRRKRSMNQYDLEADVLEFIGAIGRFKERSGRPFPTWSEVLAILKGLGYEKRGPE